MVFLVVLLCRQIEGVLLDSLLPFSELKDDQYSQLERTLGLLASPVAIVAAAARYLFRYLEMSGMMPVPLILMAQLGLGVPQMWRATHALVLMLDACPVLLRYNHLDSEELLQFLSCLKSKELHLLLPRNFGR